MQSITGDNHSSNSTTFSVIDAYFNVGQSLPVKMSCLWQFIMIRLKISNSSNILCLQNNHRLNNVYPSQTLKES